MDRQTDREPGTTIMAKLGTLYIPRSGSVVDSCVASKSTTFFSCREALGYYECDFLIF